MEITAINNGSNFDYGIYKIGVEFLFSQTKSRRHASSRQPNSGAKKIVRETGQINGQIVQNDIYSRRRGGISMGPEARLMAERGKTAPRRKLQILNLAAKSWRRLLTILFISA